MPILIAAVALCAVAVTANLTEGNVSGISVTESLVIVAVAGVGAYVLAKHYLK